VQQIQLNGLGKRYLSAHMTHCYWQYTSSGSSRFLWKMDLEDGKL